MPPKKERTEESPRLTFEQAFDRLVEVTEKLESGEGTLSEMTALFEEGVSLSKQCAEELDSVERKVEILLGDKDQPQSFDFEGAVED